MMRSRIDSNDEPQVNLFPLPDVPSATERAVSGTFLCYACGAVLVGRRPQTDYCSNRCRSSASRARRWTDVNVLVGRVDEAFATLKRALGVRL